MRHAILGERYFNTLPCSHARFPRNDFDSLGEMAGDYIAHLETI